MGIFSFLSGKKKKSKDANTNSSSSNYTSDNYLQASGIGSQIANDQIDNLINNNQDLKNKAGNVVINSKFDNIMKGETNPNKMNSAQKVIYDFYNTGTNAYQQEMQKIIDSNPSAAQAYKKRFPITSAIKNIGGTASNLIPGVGMAKSILGVLNKMGGKVKSGASLVGDKTGITDSKVYRDLANAPSSFVKDLKNMLTIDDGNKEETVSLDIESIKNDKKIKKNNFINTDNLSEEQKLELWNKAQTAGEIVNNSTVNQIVNRLPYQYQANQNDFDALRGNRSLDFSQIAGSPKEGDNRFNNRFNNVGIGGVTLDSTAYRNYLANKAGYPDTGINNTNMLNEMKDNPTLINRESPTGLNFNALGEISNPQDLDASLRDDFLNRKII